MSDTVQRQIQSLQRHQRLIWVFLFPVILFFNATLVAHLVLVYFWTHRDGEVPSRVEAHAFVLVDPQGSPIGMWTQDGLRFESIRLLPGGTVKIGNEGRGIVLDASPTPTLELMDFKGGTLTLGAARQSTSLVASYKGSSFRLDLTEDAGALDLQVDDTPVWHEGDPRPISLEVGAN
jgi:hypothetical protein